jgi:hypothetical protein
MSLRNSIEEKIVRFAVNPLFKAKPLDFKKTLKNASRILILLPSSAAHRMVPKAFKQIEIVFQDKRLTFVHSGQPSQAEKQNLKHPVIYLHLKRQSVWQLRKSRVLSDVVREHFDILLDLDPEFNLTGIFLAKRRPFSLCIGLSKPCIDRYYNVQYNGSLDAAYDEKWSGLFRFLKSFMTK